MKLIEEKILDRQFTKLIRKSLAAGYFEFNTYQYNIVGTPQGSVISPILANIFMHQLDLFVGELKDKFDIGIRSVGSKESRAIEYQIRRAKKLGDRVTALKLSRKTRSLT